MGKYVTDPEAAFVRMLANRVLRQQRDAEAKGDEFHPVGGVTTLASGYRVRLKHVEAPGGYDTVAQIWPPDGCGTLVLNETAELASELIGRPAKLRANDPQNGFVRAYLEYEADV